MPYDVYGNPVERRVGPRKVRERNLTPLQTVAAMVMLLLVVAAVLFMTRNLSEQKQEQTVTDAKPKGPTHDSMCVSYTYNGEAIRWYVVTDPDTQRQYLFNDRGGVCLREPHEERDEGMRVIRHDDGTVEYIDTKTDSEKQQVTVE